MRIIEMIADERRLIADLLSELTPEQLATQSLCDPMRRPLGLKREIPRERAEASLRFLAASPREFVAKGRLEGLALVATDLSFSSGSGALVSGPAEALLLAITGRPVALDELSGQGVALLRERMSRP